MGKKFLFTFVLFFFSLSLYAKTIVRVKALGTSPKGQYVAFEEFGYKSLGKEVAFSRIRVMNMWKNRYVDRPIQVIGKDEKERLGEIRQKAKDLAIKKLKKYNIM